MRTNIDIDDDLIAEALDLSASRTKKEVVDRALREFVDKRRRRSILDLVGKVEWRGDLDKMRTDPDYVHDRGTRTSRYE
ncbi:MAG: type II toxin-antitoxin system VapB family antitoxin [Pseudomonadota bacterium]